MSAGLVLGVAELAADRRVVKVRQLSELDSIDAVTPQEIGALDSSKTVALLVAVGLPFFLLGIYLDWLRFRDGTKWERVGQVSGLVFRLFAIPLRSLDSPYPSAALILASDAADAAAAVSQLVRGEHYIANGLALSGDVLTAVTIGMYIELLREVKAAPTKTSAELPQNVAGFG
jgi:hypothetical protein